MFNRSGHSRPSRRLAAAVFLAVLLALGAASVAAAQPGASNPGNFANQVGPGAYRLDGTDPGLPLDDLAPLRRIVGDARFVGLGEAVHTNGGYYRMKHRLFRFLVEEMGFRVFAFESPWTWVEQLEAYVQTCQGTPEDAVGGLFTVFRSTETAALAKWMCEWNQTHPQDRIHVYGFDIQRQAKVNGDGLIAYLETAGVAADNPWIPGIRACDGVDETFYPSRPFPQERYDQCQGALAQVAGFFDANERDLKRATSREALAWGRIRLVSERAWQEQIFYRADFPRSYVARERGMAYVLLAINDLRFGNQKTAIWAHNGHLWRDSEPVNGLVGMGDLLAEELGRRYVVIGQTSRETYTDWPALGLCGSIDLLGENPVEEVFHGLGESFLLVDLDPRGTHPGLLPEGAAYSFEGSELIVPAQHLDAIVYHEVAPAMNPLAWLPCH